MAAALFTFFTQPRGLRKLIPHMKSDIYMRVVTYKEPARASDRYNYDISPMPRPEYFQSSSHYPADELFYHIINTTRVSLPQLAYGFVLYLSMVGICFGKQAMMNAGASSPPVQTSNACRSMFQVTVMI